MIPLRYTAADTGVIVKRLTNHHAMRVSVQVMDLNHQPIADLTNTLLDGQVNIDARAEVTRSLTLSFADPGGTLSFESDSPADGALYADRMLRVIYTIGVPSLGWVDFPVFTGPAVKLDRAADVVNIECQGKEHLALGVAWATRTFKRGAYKHHVIREILADLCGETRFTFPSRSERLSEDLSIGRQSIPWQVCQRLAHSMDLQLFYDGRGVCRLRRLPSTPSFIFRGGTGGSVVTAPQVSYSIEGVKNTVQVKGGTPRGEHKAVGWIAVADRTHPLSPYRMGRKRTDGTIAPRHLLEVVEASNIRSEKEARRVAEQTLDHLLAQQVDVAFDSMPIPLLEELDMSRLVTDEFEQPFRIERTSLPLVVGQTQSVGYLKRVSVKPRRSRRR